MDEKLDELLKLTRENNSILRKMHRAQVWSGIFRFIYWAAIIGTTVGAWYYFQPMINQYMNTYQSLVGKVDAISGVGGVGQNIQDLRNLLGQ